MTPTPKQTTETKPTNKQELGAYIKAVVDAVSLNNAVLVDLSVKKLNDLLDTLPDNWIPENN